MSGYVSHDVRRAGAPAADALVAGAVMASARAWAVMAGTAPAAGTGAGG
jgi:hypothetical protein